MAVVIRPWHNPQTNEILAIPRHSETCEKFGAKNLPEALRAGVVIARYAAKTG